MALENLQVTPEVTPESPEYVAEMAAKGEAAVNGGVAPEAAPEIPAKPEGIPDKFYNAETGVVDYAALAKSYTELEKAQAKKAEAPKAETPPAKEGNQTPDAKAANEAVEAAGLDMGSLSQEYAENGTLSEDSYAKFEKVGITKDIVDSFIEGQQAKAEIARSHAFSITEGADGYAAMVAYAQANLSPEEINAYNTAVNSQSASVRDLAIRGMWSRYTSESGNTGADLVTGKVNTKGSDGSYQSRAEMMADMNDPKYKTDEAFRKKVQDKLGRSSIF